MSEQKAAPVPIEFKKKQGKPKGRSIDPAARSEVQALVKGESLAPDLLIEHLHKIQDKFGHISSKHIAALAAEMKMSQT